MSWLILLLKTLNSTSRCTTFHILVWSTTARTQPKLSAKIHCKVKNAAYSALKVINRYCKQTHSSKLFLKIKITLLLPSSPLLIFPFSSAHQELHGFFYNYPGFWIFLSQVRCSQLTVSQVKPGASDMMTVQAPSKCTSLNTLKLQNYHPRIGTTHSIGENSYLRAAIPCNYF